MAIKEIANKLTRPVAVSKNADICRVDGALIPFDISRDLSHSIMHSPNVNAQGAPVLHVQSLIRGVEGNQGQGISSGVAQGDGFVLVKTGAPLVNTNGRCTARNLSECEMNTSADGASNGTTGHLYTSQSVPLYTEGPTKKFRWNDCKEADEALRAMDGETERAGETPWDLGFNLEGESLPNPKGGWTFTGKANVWAVVSVSLPEWENIPDDPAVKKAWQDMIDLLRKHEEGHVVIAAEGAKELDGVTVSGRGRTPDDAVLDAKAKFEERIQALRDKIDAAEKAYDFKTKHGITQDAVGGIPVKLICP